MARLFLVFCLLFSGIASAKEGDVAVQVRTIAHHFDGGDSNDNIPGLGIEYEAWDRVKLGYIHGRNSMTTVRYSNYLSAQYVWFRNKEWDVGTVVSVADNYRTRYVHDDTKTLVSFQGCNNTTERLQVCGIYNAYATGTYTPSVALLFKFRIN